MKEKKSKARTSAGGCSFVNVMVEVLSLNW